MGTDQKTGALRPLTKVEIDRRIGDLISEVAGAAVKAAGPDEMDPVGGPQWITSAELVKRMSRFLVYN